MQDALIEVRRRSPCMYANNFLSVAVILQGYRRYNASLVQNNYPVVVAPVGHAFRIINLDDDAVVSFGTPHLNVLSIAYLH